MFRAKLCRSERFHVRYLFSFAVAPYAGAWIEIQRLCNSATQKPSPPMRGRGLKYEEDTVGVLKDIQSPPMRGRGLKSDLTHIAENSHSSPPMRGRGLKYG